jgi:hypothetical protein
MLLSVDSPLATFSFPFAAGGTERSMQSFHLLENEVRGIVQHCTDPTVMKLRKVVLDLCEACNNLERQVEEARDEARQAMRWARG